MSNHAADNTMTSMITKQRVQLKKNEKLLYKYVINLFLWFFFFIYLNE